jgi:hypothetical protein
MPRVGQELLGTPFSEMVAKMAMGIAQAQQAFAAWCASVRADVSHNRKFGREVRGTSRLFTRLAPVPPPPRIAPELTGADDRPGGGDI